MNDEVRLCDGCGVSWTGSQLLLVRFVLFVAVVSPYLHPHLSRLFIKNIQTL